MPRFLFCGCKVNTFPYSAPNFFSLFYAVCEVEFISLSSYKNATKSSGVVEITRDLQRDITGRDIIVVEDIPVSYTHLDVYKRQPVCGAHSRRSRYRQKQQHALCPLLDIVQVENVGMRNEQAVIKAVMADG